MDKIADGWEVEDPNGLYDDDDKLTSAIGTVQYNFFGDDKAVAEDVLAKIS